MNWRVTLGLSLTANLILAMGWLWMSNSYARRLAQASVAPEAPAPTLVKTNFLVRRQFFSWQELESADYSTYIKNLRAIGCPEQTIRDLIIADVNALYARKRATEVITPAQQWWRSSPDEEILRMATARLSEMDQERRLLLTQLLGPGWESGDLLSLPRPTRPGVELDGPVLGALPTNVKQAVQEIYARSQERFAAYLSGQAEAGLPADPATLAGLRQQARAELAGVLTGPQLEEYLLRHSEGAAALRAELGRLKYFETTPDEFRALFRATDAIDLQLQALAGATDPARMEQRRLLESQRLAALQTVLGPERFEQFSRLHDELYQNAYAAALRAGSPETVGTLYAIAQAAQEEEGLIRARTNLSPEQLAIELKRAELEALKGAARAVGQEVPPEPPLPPAPEPHKTHVLKSGEGLIFLARLYGVEPAALQAANPNIDFTRLRGGEAVNIPIKLLPVIPVPIR